MELRTGKDDANRRLDRILRKALRHYPLSLIHRLLRQGRILVDGKPGRSGDLIPSGAAIIVPDLNFAAQTSQVPRLPFSDTPLFQILWQGAGLLILNKPAGLAVHGPDGLDALVRAYLAGGLSPSLSFRPGPLHRLDKPASGIIVFSTSLEGARHFSALMRERRIQKQYLALVEGPVAGDERWQDDLVRDRNTRKTYTAGEHPSAAGPVMSQTAITTVKPVAANARYSLVLAEIATGRTHQIRAQAAAHGHPLAGDRKYGGHVLPAQWNCRQQRFFLHAWKLGLRETTFTAPLPDDFRERITMLFGDTAGEFSS
jgi:23S rRNA pseudouridine955/2504/2580 synthase